MASLDSSTQWPLLGVIFVATISILVPDLSAAKPMSSFPCGKPQVPSERKPRVVGGKDSYAGEFPWTVSVRFPFRHHCGGTILSRDWILTAAHCVVGYSPSEFRVRLGAIDPDNDETLEIPVKSVMIHHDFNAPLPMANDIALLRLEHPVNFTRYMLPICLPPHEDPDEVNFYEGSRATVVGWGWTSYEPSIFPPGRSPGILQKVDVKVIENDECSSWFRSRGKRVTLDTRQFCAGYEDGGKDSCRGDSGGPLVIKENVTNTYYLIGIVSAGIGCAERRMPGVYTRVSTYLDWIREKIDKTDPHSKPFLKNTIAL